MVEDYRALTDKEKQTLRLLLEGYDAKSIARHLGLSVHTINERLRDARRKLAVSSSKEAARRLRDFEETAPETIGDGQIGAAERAPIDQEMAQPRAKPLSRQHAIWVIGGLVMISFVVALLALAAPTSQTSQITCNMKGTPREDVQRYTLTSEGLYFSWDVDEPLAKGRRISSTQPILMSTITERDGTTRKVFAKHMWRDGKLHRIQYMQPAQGGKRPVEREIYDFGNQTIHYQADGKNIEFCRHHLT